MPEDFYPLFKNDSSTIRARYDYGGRQLEIGTETPSPAERERTIWALKFALWQQVEFMRIKAEEVV